MRRLQVFVPLALVLMALFASRPLAAGTATNVRATQLSERSVGSLYDLSGAIAEGASVSFAVSSDHGERYTITPAASPLFGQAGTGFESGTNRRIGWRSAATLPVNTPTRPLGGGQFSRSFEPRAGGRPSLPGGTSLR